MAKLENTISYSDSINKVTKCDLRANEKSLQLIAVEVVAVL